MDPLIYRILARWGLYLVIFVAFVVGGLTLRHAWAEKKAAEARVETLGAELAAQIRNADSVAAVTRAAEKKTNASRSSIAAVNMEVRRAGAGDIPKECENAVADAFAGIDAALRGLRRVEADGGASAADVVLRASAADSVAHVLRAEREADLRRPGGRGIHHGQLALR